MNNKLGILTADKVTYRYGGAFEALSEVSFSVEKGDFLAILGPNGSGKTTLLEALSGVLMPSEGQVLLEGAPIRKMPRREVARRISFVPQHIRVDFPFTVREVVLMGRYSHLQGMGIEGEEDYRVAGKAMEMTGVDDLADRMIHQLSGGERQRVFIAQAIAAQAPVMMLDEPVSSLDIKHKTQVLDLMGRLNREQGITIITILHDLNLASCHARRLLLLKRGKVEAEGVPEEVLNPENISKVYDVKVEIIKSGDEKRSFIMPVSECTEPAGEGV